MYELFTIEEVNLMCIFDTSSRDALVAEITAAISDFDEPELVEIAENVVTKLAKISDADFAALELYPEYEDYLVKKYADEQGYKNLVLYADNGVNGIGFERPALGCLCADILTGCVKTVIVSDLSRINRNPVELSAWIYGIRRCGVSFVSIVDGITDDMFDKKDELFLKFCEYLERSPKR